eukprot:TRINITY_DN27688_c0_g1_i1.p1 TRINITY_DN27688_c0_g1~~TRINITY_DN27688_c0_g1_i1.p1  ORF type:complete len:411 (-),score=112.46 TRINITY_DN27688_c0_g1_i1:107-1339(-)
MEDPHAVQSHSRTEDNDADDVKFLRQAVEQAMSEKARALRTCKELEAVMEQLQDEHSRVQREYHYKNATLEKKAAVLHAEMVRSQESESMMRQQTALLKQQLEHETEQRIAGEELCASMSEMMHLVVSDMEGVESEAVRLAAVEDEYVVLVNTPMKPSPCRHGTPGEETCNEFSTPERNRSLSVDRAACRAAHEASEISELRKQVELLEGALVHIKSDQRTVVALAKERCGSLASPEAQTEIEENISLLRSENKVLKQQLEESKTMHTAEYVFQDTTEDGIYEEMIAEYAQTAGKVQTKDELVEAIEFSQRHSDNPFEALVHELYQSYKGMKRSLIKVKAEKVFLAEEITSLQVELDMMKLKKDDVERARKGLCVELQDAKGRYAKIQALLSSIKQHPTFQQLTGATGRS